MVKANRLGHNQQTLPALHGHILSITTTVKGLASHPTMRLQLPLETSQLLLHLPQRLNMAIFKSPAELASG